MNDVIDSSLGSFSSTGVNGPTGFTGANGVTDFTGSDSATSAVPGNPRHVGATQPTV